MRRLRQTEGFSIVEVMVAILLLTIGAGAVIASVPAAKRRAQVSERQLVATLIAERELQTWSQGINNDSGGADDYKAIALCDQPPHANVSGSTVQDPRYWVSGSRFRTVTNRLRTSSTSVSGATSTGSDGEPMVVDPAASACRPSRTSSYAEGGYTYRIDRFVTYVDDDCSGMNSRADTVGGLLNSLLSSVLGAVNNLLQTLLGTLQTTLKTDVTAHLNALCTGYDNGKRLTIAVTANQAGLAGRSRSPVWLSTVVTNPRAGSIEVST